MRRAAAAALLAAVLAASPAGAAPQPAPYGTNDAGGFRNVLPPGSSGLADLVELGAFLGAGARPAHNDDQLGLYRDALTMPRPWSPQTLDQVFKDARFGVPEGGVESTVSPRDDVTIVRDAAYGVPRITATTRDGAMFGIGYASAEDRLFFMDVFRHLGRAQLSSFAGGAPANREFDALMWSVAPYTEQDMQTQVEQRPQGFEAEADRLHEDLRQYVAGVNAYIAEARVDARKMPGEYAALGRPRGPDDWKETDAVATAAVAGAIFGVGGGEELESALVLEAARKRFGGRRGERIWKDFRSADDPEGPTTVHTRPFPYARPPGKPRGRALPDPGSLRFTPLVEAAAGPGAGDSDAQAASEARAASASARAASPATAAARGLLAFPKAQSNALVVAAAGSASGRPLAVFGPQTAYFAPQVLMEQEVHAPTLDVRGVAFPGSNLFVQIGHGRDYAWSATTSAQDIVDTFAVDLCDPGGGPATLESSGYRFHGACRPIEALERTNAWEPNTADPTPAGSETLRAERTAMGLVRARGTVKGRPVAFTSLRATYRHEVDSGLAFSHLNDPDRIRGPEDFRRAAGLVPYTFNWFYVDSEHVAYQNAGANPLRARRVDGGLPVLARKAYEWRRWEPGPTTKSLVESSAGPDAHPHAIDQAYFADWNGKQARGYGAADGNWGYGPVYRSKLLDDRVRNLLRGGRKTTLPELGEAMIDAATVDLRGDAVLPYALRVLEGSRNATIREAAGLLAAWQRDGAHRVDRDGDGEYEHRDAIRIMDAWWPLWLRAQFEPTLGEDLFRRIAKVHGLDNHPNNHGDHLGSAWQDGWYSFAQKDLRTLLKRKVRGRWSRVYCGGGRLARCRAALERSLAQALQADPAELYRDPICAGAGRDGQQTCFDTIWHRPLGGVTQPLIPWQNRPTFQQAVEIPGRVPR